MQTKRVVEYLFLAVLSLLGTIGVSYMHQISETLLELTKNVADLNSRMAVITQKIEYNINSVQDHEYRIRKIEYNQKK